jgi:hypothetical protein
MKSKVVKIVGSIIVLMLILAGIGAVYYLYETEKEEPIEEKKIPYPLAECITFEADFSEPEIVENEFYTNVYVDEADFYDIHDGWPVIPVKTKTYELAFGTEILDVTYEHTKPKNYTLPSKLSFGSCSVLTGKNKEIYDSSKSFPEKFVSYHTGGGLSNGEHKTFLTIRVNPFTYRPADDEIDFVDNVTVNVYYEEPASSLLHYKNDYDLLIVTIKDFTRPLKPLVDHKEKQGIKTKLVTLNDLNENNGRDIQEKIKYYIKDAIEEWGVRYVLLVGGMKGQGTKWNLPVRYSHVLVEEGKQESPEPEFISDLYFADIYDSEGNFSSWDTNNNDVFAEREGAEKIDEMDLYPDVYLGRLPCRNKREVRIVVDKITKYESKKADDSWFKNLIMVSGDHWPDPEQISEGVLIMEEAERIMSDFTPVKLLATEDNILLIKDINKAINKGAGFAYFCGHGGSTSWGIHYPPDATGWAPSLTRLQVISFYNTIFMNFLRNKYKLPITVVGGCFNGKLDISIGKSLQKGKLGLTNSNCWAWKLASKKGGGSIATIANTGLGTHAMSDADDNGVNDYLEVLDGWLELRFFELYAKENIDVLGDLHSTAINDYLDTFLCSNDEMDQKMAQQWFLFGDPSLKIGGY